MEITKTRDTLIAKLLKDLMKRYKFESAYLKFGADHLILGRNLDIPSKNIRRFKIGIPSFYAEISDKSELTLDMVRMSLFSEFMMAMVTDYNAVRAHDKVSQLFSVLNKEDIGNVLADISDELKRRYIPGTLEPLSVLEVMEVIARATSSRLTEKGSKKLIPGNWEFFLKD